MKYYIYEILKIYRAEFTSHKNVFANVKTRQRTNIIK